MEVMEFMENIDSNRVIVTEVRPVKKVYPCIEQMKDEFGLFGSMSICYGLVYGALMYQNPYGAAFPFFIAIVYTVLILMLKRLHVAIKKDSWYLILISVMLGISTCMTADETIHFFNKTGLLLLLLIFMLHQFYEDSNWDFSKYLVSAD